MTQESTGYIVTDNELIHGYGPSADAAWADAIRTLDMARIKLLADDEDSTEELGSWMRASDLKIRPASPQMLADVEAKGGAIGWRIRDGVAITCDEE